MGAVCNCAYSLEIGAVKTGGGEYVPGGIG